MSDDVWKSCSSCKKPIEFGARYWVCSVSTCNRSRTQLYFCRVACWDAHLPLARHRSSAYAIEKKAPTREQWEAEEGSEHSDDSSSRSTSSTSTSSSGGGGGAAVSLNEDDLPMDRLVVASRLKEWIADLSEMRTSGTAMHALSHLIRRECDQAIRNAVEDGRKTVKSRDFIRAPAGTRDPDVLVVTSKVKKYIKARSGLRTGGDVEDILSAHVRGWSKQAIRAARADDRGTVLDRDFDSL